MKRLAMQHDIIIVSVFNKKLFKDFGLKTFYGREVRQTVGEIINSKQDEDNSILRTKKGNYSKWFSKHDLEQLFNKANISNYRIMEDRKSTRLNSSHRCISYAVFCLKKKIKKKKNKKT